MEKRDVPKKNYIILVGVIVLILMACFAAYNIYNIYQENMIKTSPLAETVILYDDLKNATTEINADTFLVISYVEDQKVYNNEKEIRKMLTKKDLLGNVMYLNVTDYMMQDGFIKELNEVLKLKDRLAIETLPAIVYYKDGVAVKTVDSKDSLINVGDFEQLIDMYELAS